MKNPKDSGSTPRALAATKDAVIVIDENTFAQPIRVSRQSERGRVILPFHKSEQDPLQRMLNVLQPGSYIQPHRHMSPPKAESIIVLKGSIACVSFRDDGQIDGVFTMSAGTDRYGIDIDAGVYHTFFALEEDTVLFEVKAGPFDPKADKGFAPWAPAEGTEEAKSYLERLRGLVSP